MNFGAKFIEMNLRLFWRQIYFENDLGSWTREVFIGNLKDPHNHQGGKWFRPSSYREFREYALERLEGFRREDSWPGIYISCERYHGSILEARDLVFDIDFDENDPEKAYQTVKFLNLKLHKIGVNVLWSLSGNGIHGRVDMLPVYLNIDPEEADELLRNSPRIYKNFAQFLTDLASRNGYNIKFDLKIYSSRRLIRAIYSPHETKKIIEKPLDFRWSVKTNFLLATKDFINVSRGPLNGWVEKPLAFVNLLREIDCLYQSEGIVQINNVKLMVKRPRGRWAARDGIKYDRALEGYGYIEEIVERPIFFADGRSTFIWYILSKAVINGIITKEEAVEWIKKCIEKYPDPNKTVQDYIRKLFYNTHVRVNPPTWRTLLDLSGEMASVREHILNNLLPALEEAGLVRRVLSHAK